MKKITLLLSSFIFLLAFSVNAQVEETEVTMSLGNQNAFKVELKDADTKTAEKVWKEFVKEYGKVKKNKKAKEFYMEQTSIPSVNGNDNCDVYVKFEERAGLTNAFVWFDVGNGFLNSEDNPTSSNGAMVLLTEYANSVQKYIIGKELEEENKTMKNFEKDLSKLEKDNKNYHKEIEEAREKIRKAEINIEKNVVAQENKHIEIKDQAGAVKEVEFRLNNVGKSEKEIAVLKAKMEKAVEEKKAEEKAKAEKEKEKEGDDEDEKNEKEDDKEDGGGGE